VLQSNRKTTHIVGCGDIGRRVASLLLSKQQGVHSWSKTIASRSVCQRMGLIAHCCDFDKTFEARELTPNSDILYTVPPPSAGRQDSRLKNFLRSLDTEKVQRFILISTTGVYGDCAGAEVDETTPINPRAERAVRRADAEEKLAQWAKMNDINYLILRVPGIYAKDRLPLSRLQAGTPVLEQRSAPWTNRIHADDLATVCCAALRSTISGEIINITDDKASTMTDYFFAVADFAEIPRPPQISMLEAQQSLSPGMLSYLIESRRVSNAKMKRLLDVRLRYPTLAHGLATDHPH
jgi:NAD dependent epimerase/dehydratase family enzyme